MKLNKRYKCVKERMAATSPLFAHSEDMVMFKKQEEANGRRGLKNVETVLLRSLSFFCVRQTDVDTQKSLGALKLRDSAEGRAQKNEAEGRHHNNSSRCISSSFLALK